MEGSFNNTTALPPQEDCQPLTAEEEELYQELASRISWWFEGLLQCCVGSIGFLANVTFPPLSFSSVIHSELFLKICSSRGCQRTS